MRLARQRHKGVRIGYSAMQWPQTAFRQTAHACLRRDAGVDGLVAAERYVEIREGRGVEQAEYRPPPLDQTNVDGELRPALDEAVGAIERIHQEESASDVRDAAGRHLLLGDDRDPGGQTRQAR